MKENLSLKRSLLVSVIMGLALIGASPAFADNAVKLRILLITTGDITTDPVFAYIKPVLDEMGVQYDVFNANTQDLTAAMLASSSTGAVCKAQDAGCIGSYNGIILTDSDLVPAFTPSEWDILHDYQKNFGVREAVLSGWPATYSDPGPPSGIYLDYGLVYSSSGNNYEGTWSVPTTASKEIFEYVNQANPLPITDFAFAANPRNDGTAMRDGTVATVEPLLKTQNGEALVSVVRYMMPNQATPAREVMISTITNASFLIHSKVLAYEFVNWATQGVFVGKRYVHMAAHVDDLFLSNSLWDSELKNDHPTNTYRLNSGDIANAVSQQNAFRAAHPTAGAFKLDFAFNGSGAVVDPEAMTLAPNLTEDLVAAVVANKAQFRFINHTFTHADMDKAPVPANAPCDYETFTTIAAIKAEITKNRKVWDLLTLPERSQNNRVLVSGNHSGLKDRKCTADPALHPEMFDVQSDDVAFDEGGANPLFLQAVADLGVDYLASDSSQKGQNLEQYITQYDDGSNTDRVMLPRWPTSVFYNVTNPALLVDEYNYIFHDRFVKAGQNPCEIPGAICTPRNYAEILLAEADTASRHMLMFNKWPHFFHQTNVAKYDASGSTLQFDWLSAVFAQYERLFKLPVRNYPFYLIGDNTEEGLKAKAAAIQAVWNRATNQVTLSANVAVPLLFVTGISGGELYGGQFIRRINITTTPASYGVNRGLTQ
ncbi:hypothetical protein SAMN05216403_11436 [Nitrosospira multiformis ATCC 25196]|uniref:Agd3 deacetylase domain-containing protein n=1 Tax=Nitrosospira multiformis (strain ATCC 25196 / NCIMB 11849 / C 71) TaxID=323848 RepID=Q2Y693_NITMU|nr:hypothetical protein [Nitrosospira multiformis]ABB75728.1 hypothetical protein Nmul_A2439 [Nitrosospira multiformis ATCC 25196]SEF90651.1 hypothetical protein SAMN05216403_11436 [Nitrosospira multiformis ATCC 25196]